MKKYILLILVIVCAQLTSGQEIERVEPPFWWVGMQNSSVQLMVYGKNILASDAVIDSDDIKVTSVHQADSPNYIFIDLKIGENAKAGKYKIHLKNDSGKIAELVYEFKERKLGSAARKGFDNSDVLYLITPDRFANGDPSNDEIAGLKEGLDRTKEYGRHGGDLAGINQHLDYIKDMGFTAIWLNPVLINDQHKWSYHGYATTDYYNVDPRFGTNEEYVKLSQDARKMGIGMIMDIIVNHCGSEHWWMKDPPFSNWINYQDKPYQETNHRKETLLDPYAAAADRKIMTQGWFVKAMPDLNQHNPFMSTYLIQNSIWWIEYADLAGIRQDTYSYPFRDFMTDWTCAIQNEYPYFNIVGEEWVDDPSMISYWQKGKMNTDGYTSCLRSLMDFPMTFALHKALKEKDKFDEGIIRLYKHLSYDYHYAEPNNLVIFPDNHDMSRIYTQLNEDIHLFKMALAYILTTRGVPQIYYGTEILMSNKGTDSHGIIRSDYPGGWADDPKDAFLSIGIDSLALDTREWIKNLLNWRQSKSVIHNGKLMHYIPENGLYVYFRYDENETVMVIMNNNQSSQSLDLVRFNDRTKGFKSANLISDHKSKTSYPLDSPINIDGKSILILELMK